MKKIITAILVTAILIGCVHRDMWIQKGNWITDNKGNLVFVRDTTPTMLFIPNDTPHGYYRLFETSGWGKHHWQYVNN